jgi:DNA invertase Pin-like site-specific DNA recombinase
MKLAAYTRVSTDRQADAGMGLEIQQETLQRWAKQNGHRIVSWHTDAGQSGSNGLELRLGLVDALDAVKMRKAEGLVVARLDRLARDLILQETLLADVRRHGGRVHSAASGEDAHLDDDATDPSRKLIRQILGAVAEWERAMIRMRMEAGRTRKLEAGGYAYGQPAYGWRAEGGELVKDELEQSQIALIAAMRSQGASLRTIADHLETLGVPTRKGNTRWSTKVLADLLKRAEEGTT